MNTVPSVEMTSDLPGGMSVEETTSVARTSELALQHLNERGYVPFHPVLAHRFGHRAALFIGICLYWTRHSLTNSPHRQGWFHMSARQISDATTLTRREQETVRALLEARGVLQQRLAGRPAVTHYRLNLKTLGQALEVIDAGNVTVDAAWTWFQNSVSFYRPLADLAGNAASGLYLSYLLRTQRQAILRRQLRGDCIRVSQDAVSEALRLSPKVQRSARERLRKSGLIVEAGPAMVRINIQAILACIRVQAIQPLPRRGNASAEKSLPPAARPQNRMPEASGAITATSPQRMIGQNLLPIGRDEAGPLSSASPTPGTASIRIPMHLMASMVLMPAATVAGIPQVEGEPSQVLPANADQGCPLQFRAGIAQNANVGEQRVAQTANLKGSISAQSAKLGLPKTPIYIEQTGITNTTTNTGAKPLVDKSGGGQIDGRRRSDVLPPNAGSADREEGRDDLDGLVFPKALAATAMPGVRHVLLQANPAIRQALLDELEGQTRIAGKTIHNPAGWLLGLEQRMKIGAVLALAEQVAQERQHRKAVQAQIEASTAGARMETSASSVESHRADPEVVRQNLAQLRQLRNQIVRKA